MGFLNDVGVSHLWGKIKTGFQAKELKTGSTTEYKMLSDNNLTNELVTKIGASQTAEDVNGAITTATADLQNAEQVGTAITNATKDFKTGEEITNEITEATKDFATDTEVADAITEAVKDFATDKEVEDAITEAVKDFATDGEVETAITNATKDLQNAEQVNTAIANATKDFATGDQVNGAIADAVGEITSFEFAVVEALPEAGEKGIVYLVANGGEGTNVYDEYIYVNGKFEKIGTTEVDLSGYVKEETLEDYVAAEDALSTDEIDALLV